MSNQKAKVREMLSNKHLSVKNKKKILIMVNKNIRKETYKNVSKMTRKEIDPIFSNDFGQIERREGSKKFTIEYFKTPKSVDKGDFKKQIEQIINNDVVFKRKYKAMQKDKPAPKKTARKKIKFKRPEPKKAAPKKPAPKEKNQTAIKGWEGDFVNNLSTNMGTSNILLEQNNRKALNQIRSVIKRQAKKKKSFVVWGLFRSLGKKIGDGLFRKYGYKKTMSLITKFFNDYLNEDEEGEPYDIELEGQDASKTGYDGRMFSKDVVKIISNQASGKPAQKKPPVKKPAAKKIEFTYRKKKYIGRLVDDLRGGGGKKPIFKKVGSAGELIMPTKGLLKAFKKAQK